VKAIKDAIITSYRFNPLTSFSRCDNAVLSRDSFLFLVFLRLYNQTLETHQLEIEHKLSSLNEFYDYLHTLADMSPSKSALKQVLEHAVESFRQAEQTTLLDNLTSTWADLANVSNQIVGYSRLDTLNLYRWVLLSLQQMNDTNVFEVDVEPIESSEAFGELLTVIDKDLTQQPCYLGETEDAEGVISLLSFNADLPVSITAKEQGTHHLLRFLALIHASNVEVLSSSNDRKFLRCVNINSPHRLAIKYTSINAEDIKKELPRYHEFDHGLHMISQLNSKGTGYLFLSKMALNRQQDALQRMQFVESGWINSVVMLPERLLGRQVYELILIKLKANSDSVSFIDARHCYQTFNGIQRPARLNDLNRLMARPNAENERCWQVPLNNIIENNASLNPHAYQSNRLIEDNDLNSLQVEHSILITKLMEIKKEIDVRTQSFIS
jgi:hypothetical protein